MGGVGTRSGLFWFSKSGGQFTGNFCARELKKQFHVTVVDCKEFFLACHPLFGAAAESSASNTPLRIFL